MLYRKMLHHCYSFALMKENRNKFLVRRMVAHTVPNFAATI